MKLDRREANNTEKSAPKPGGPGGAKQQGDKCNERP